MINKVDVIHSKVSCSSQSWSKRWR